MKNIEGRKKMSSSNIVNCEGILLFAPYFLCISMALLLRVLLFGDGKMQFIVKWVDDFWNFDNEENDGKIMNFKLKKNFHQNLSKLT